MVKKQPPQVFSIVCTALKKKKTKEMIVFIQINTILILGNKFFFVNGMQLNIFLNVKYFC
jgi:hypothetical protein